MGNEQRAPSGHGVVPPAWRCHGAPLMLAAAVFLACLLGIHTRPAGFLASFWPANAIMLGLLIRVPAAAGAAGWFCAGAAYMAADLLSGSGLLKAALLNAANLAGIGTAWRIYARLPADMARLRHPVSMLYLVLAAAAAGAVAGGVGGIANPLLFQGGALRGWAFWFATEFVNYIAILPVMLAAPPLHALAPAHLRRAAAGLDRRRLMPAAALALACAAGLVFGGPGAIAFPVPALLWCGLAYPVFPTAVLSLLSGCWTLTMISGGMVGDIGRHDELGLASLRLGVSLIALAPIMLSCAMQSRNELLERLRHLATHDGLTGVRSRGAFLEQAAALANAGAPLGMLMLDLDHFKQVNDTHGHAAGDAALAAVAGRIRRCLRAGDLLGRMGGEEFAVAVAGLSREELDAMAQRIRTAIAGEPVALAAGGSVPLTASLGLAFARNPAGEADMLRLLAAADAALYRAKREGRNRVVAAADTPQTADETLQAPDEATGPRPDAGPGPRA